MQILILGLGNIGKGLAGALRSRGHVVVGTTTTPSKVESLHEFVDDVAVLFGHESEKLQAAAAGCDACVVTVAPDVKKSRSVEEREKHYREVLVQTSANAVRACPRVVCASSFSVYGDGGAGDSPIDESTPCTDDEEPSSKYYQQAEAAVLGAASGCVLRFPDMYGAPGDLTYPERVKLVHQFMGGKTVFGADAPLYCIHYLDVVAALEHALLEGLVGVYNVCDNDSLPYSNKVVFDAICDAEGLDRIEFLNQIKAPNRKISAQKIYDTGYRVERSDPNAGIVEGSES